MYIKWNALSSKILCYSLSSVRNVYLQIWQHAYSCLISSLKIHEKYSCKHIIPYIETILSYLGFLCYSFIAENKDRNIFQCKNATRNSIEFHVVRPPSDITMPAIFSYSNSGNRQYLICIYYIATEIVRSSALETLYC